MLVFVNLYVVMVEEILENNVTMETSTLGMVVMINVEKKMAGYVVVAHQLKKVFANLLLENKL